MTHVNSNHLPEWVIEWYKDNNIFNEIVHSNEEKKVDIYKIKEEDAAKSLLDLVNVNNIKRSAPKAKKFCKTCNNFFLVSSAKQNCNVCQDKLFLEIKKPKEAKRCAPKCSKKCEKCNIVFSHVATALKKCKNCGKKLYIVK